MWEIIFVTLNINPRFGYSLYNYLRKSCKIISLPFIVRDTFLVGNQNELSVCSVIFWIFNRRNARISLSACVPSCSWLISKHVLYLHRYFFLNATDNLFKIFWLDKWYNIGYFKIIFLTLKINLFEDPLCIDENFNERAMLLHREYVKIKYLIHLYMWHFDIWPKLVCVVDWSSKA